MVANPISLYISLCTSCLSSSPPPARSPARARQTLHDNTQAAIDTLKGSIALKANTVCVQCAFA